MTQTVPLQAVPNQSFSIRLDDRRYEITLKEAPGRTMVADISRDGVLLVTAMRAVPGVPLLPYESLRDFAGNFMFVTEDDDMPYYTFFESTHSLVYASPAEIEAWKLRN